MKQGWELKTLGDVCSVQRGLTYSGKDTVDYSSTVVLRATNIDLDSSSLVFDELKYLRDDFEIKEKYELKKGSLLICFSSGSKSHLGKVALVDKHYKYAFGGFIGQITPSNNIDPKYLFYSLISEDYKSYIAQLTDGVNINNLKIKDLQGFQIPVPPLEEQKQIVAKLDQCFEAIDKAKANAAKNLENAKELFQSKLNDIFSQKGEGWVEKKLGDVCSLIGGGTPSKKNKQFYTGDILWATVRDMKLDVITQTECSITKEAVSKSSTNIIPKGNVIIATRVGLGKVCLINQDTAINQDLRGVIPKEKSDLQVKYLFWWFKSISKLIINEGTGATVQGVKLPFVKSLNIPIPTTASQSNIVALLDTLQEQTQSLESKYQQELNSLEELKKSILQKAFEGEL